MGLKIVGKFWKSLAEVMILKVMVFIFKSQTIKEKTFLFLFSYFKHSVWYVKKQLKIQTISLQLTLMFLKAWFADHVYQKHLECIIKLQVVEPYPVSTWTSTGIWILTNSPVFLNHNKVWVALLKLYYRKDTMKKLFFSSNRDTCLVSRKERELKGYNKCEDDCGSLKRVENSTCANPGELVW